MQKLTTLLLLIISLISCNKDEDPFFRPEGPNSNEDYIVFGTFYGFCAGDDCISIYKITNNALYANTIKEYPSSTEFYASAYEQLPQEKFEGVKSILNSTPSKLLTIEDGFVGCPDCADGGGVYFEYKVGNIHKHWLIDQVVQNIPEELHSLVIQINDAVHTIKQ